MSGPDRGPTPRVVSLVPSATEIVAALGFGDHLVGVSHCCDHPPRVRGLPVLSESKVDPTRAGADIDRGVRALIGAGLSVYRIDQDALLAARPDVIVTQDHCDACAVSLSDVRAAVCELGLPDARVCSLDPHDLDGVRADFRAVADALGAPERGEALVRGFDRRLRSVARRAGAARGRPRVALIEWLHPPMVAGGWMPELARLAGGEPVIVREPGHFQEIGWDAVAAEDPDVVVLLPCGFGVERTERELSEPGAVAGLTSIPAVGRGACWIVDGDAYFNRPGPRLADSAELLGAILHPEAFTAEARRLAGSFRRWRGSGRAGSQPPSGTVGSSAPLGSA